MKKICLVFMMCVAGASMAVAQMLLPGDGVSLVQKPVLVDDSVHTNAPVVADTNALASMAAEEKTLTAEAKAVTIKITELSYPLRDYRQRMMSQDKELQALTKAIYDKQVELEAKLAEKYPDIGAKTKERDDLIKKYSDVNTRIRALRAKMDGMQLAIQQDAASKKSAK